MNEIPIDVILDELELNNEPKKPVIKAKRNYKRKLGSKKMVCPENTCGAKSQRDVLKIG